MTLQQLKILCNKLKYYTLILIWEAGTGAHCGCFLILKSFLKDHVMLKTGVA